MIADHDVVQERPLSCFCDYHLRAGTWRRFGRVLIDEEAFRPARDHPCGEDGVSWSREEVVRSVEGEKAFGVPRRGIDASRVVDTDGVVGGGMGNEERNAQLTGSLFDRVQRQVVEEFAADGEAAASDVDRGAPLLFDHGKLRAEQARDVRDVGRRAERCDGTDLWEIGGDGDHRRPAETVADEQLGSRIVLAKPRRREPEIVEVGREIGVGEVALTRAETGEVET